MASRELLARLAREAPLLPGADVLTFIDVDSAPKRVYGHRKQGAKFGHTKIQGKSLLVRGLNALIAAVSTPLSCSPAGAFKAAGPGGLCSGPSGGAMPRGRRGPYRPRHRAGRYPKTAATVPGTGCVQSR